jgi:hypothetical protein
MKHPGQAWGMNPAFQLIIDKAGGTSGVPPFFSIGITDGITDSLR